MTVPYSSAEEKLDAYLRLLAQCYDEQSPAPDLVARIAKKMAAQSGELSDQEMDWLSAAGTGFLPDDKQEWNKK